MIACDVCAKQGTIALAAEVPVPLHGGTVSLCYFHKIQFEEAMKTAYSIFMAYDATCKWNGQWESWQKVLRPTIPPVKNPD